MKKINEYTVFISSPNNQSENRKLVAAEIEKFSNRYVGSEISYTAIEQNDVPSTFEERPPQEIINKFFVENVDLYIGLMSTKFGTPTEKYGSGTEEEFNLALEQQKINPDFSVSFLFEETPTNLLTITDEEYNQIGKVREFKNAISNLGIYRSFNDTNLDERVADILKKHAAKILQQQNFQTEFDLQPPKALKINEHFYSSFVSNVEAEIINSHVPNVGLQSVYVPLDLTEIIYAEDDRTTDSVISADEIFDYNSASNLIILSGDEKAGKTTFCKSMFWDQKKNDLIPIYLEGEVIRNASQDIFEREVESAFIEQYDAQNLKQFIDTPSAKKIIIIDDFENSKLNFKNQIAFLAALKEKYPNIIITVSSNFFFNLNLAAADYFKTIIDFKSYEFEDMGHKLRDALIQRWIKLGREDTLSEEQLYAETDQNRHLIDSVIGSNFVPKKPFTILVLLQAIQAGLSQNLKQSSFIRYYKYLIDTTLLQGLQQSQFDYCYALLPVIAYAMFKNEKRKLTENQISDVIKDFADIKGLPEKHLVDVKSSLITLGMLYNKDGFIKFKYSYTYYFFLGQYFSENLHQTTIKDEVITICNNLHLKENANVIIFLSYHSFDPTIIDTISGQVDQLFSDTDIFDFNTQASSAINRLVTSGPKVVLANRSEEYRKTQFQERDVAERSSKASGDIKREDLEEKNYIAQANLAHRSAEILGQLLKNHYVRFDAEPKKELYLKSVNVGLRTLNKLAELLAGDQSALIELIERKLGDVSADEELEKLKKEVPRLVFNLASMIIFGFIKTTAHLNGTFDLSRTYEDVLKDNDRLIYRVIDFAIKTDFFDSFPMKELEVLAEECKNNNLAKNILSNLVRYRLNMRPLDDFRQKQKICDLVNISVADQLNSAKKIA